MITYEVSGSFQNMERFLKGVSNLGSKIVSAMHRYGPVGVDALSAATPMDTGLASMSWDYEVVSGGGVYTLWWTNFDIENGFPVAIALQYGYATGTGGYVQGQDYINPAIRPIFDQIADNVWKVVTSA